MLLLQYVAPIAGGYQYNLFNTEMSLEWDTARWNTYRCIHQTFMFQCFIMMNIFNMINCRVLDPIPQPVPEIDDEEGNEEERAEIIAANKPSFNIFTRFYQNWWFWIILFAELNV